MEGRQSVDESEPRDGVHCRKLHEQHRCRRRYRWRERTRDGILRETATELCWIPRERGPPPAYEQPHSDSARLTPPAYYGIAFCHEIAKIVSFLRILPRVLPFVFTRYSFSILQVLFANIHFVIWSCATASNSYLSAHKSEWALFSVLNFRINVLSHASGDITTSIIRSLVLASGQSLSNRPDSRWGKGDKDVVYSSPFIYNR